MHGKTQNPAGYQLTGEELRERQLGQNRKVPGPIVMAAGVNDPVNIGAIFRVCDAMNCKEIIFVDMKDADVKKIKKVSRSTSDKVPYRLISSEEFEAVASQLPTLIAIEITSHSLEVYTATMPEDICFVVGDERHGIPKNILDRCSCAVHIPMFGINSSMNVAVSLGIVLYEWYRRFHV